MADLKEEDLKEKKIGDFNYLNTLSKLEKKIPVFAKRVYPIYQVVKKTFNDTLDDHSYWIPNSPKEIEKALKDKIKLAKESKLVKNSDKYTIEGGGLRLLLEVDGDCLAGEIAVCFSENVFSD